MRKRKGLTKEQKLQRKEYRKMFRMHQKTLMEVAKHASTDPFDSECGLEFMIEHMKFMYDYYKLGWNVWAADTQRRPRVDTLKEALDEYVLAYDIDDCISSKYFNLPELDWDVVMKSKGPIEWPDDYMKPLNGLSYKEACLACNNEIADHKKKFFMMLAENLEDWWD